MMEKRSIVIEKIERKMMLIISALGGQKRKPSFGSPNLRKEDSAVQTIDSKWKMNVAGKILTFIFFSRSLSNFGMVTSSG